MIPAKEFEGELWVKASHYQEALKKAKREWIDLTDDEIRQCEQTDSRSYFVHARALEAKLKGKNT